MSHQAYNEQWFATTRSLEQLFEQEAAFTALPFKDAKTTIDHQSALYIQYLRAYRQLEECCDQMVHPQKRMLVRKMAEDTILRLLELKKEMMQGTANDAFDFTAVLSRLNLTPSALDVPTPRFATSASQSLPVQQAKKFNQRTTFVESALLTPEEAVRIIQVNERARQGRSRIRFLRDVKSRNERSELPNQAHSEQHLEKAATTIQKLVRGALARKYADKLRKEDESFLGMVPKSSGSELIGQASETAKKRQEQRKLWQEEYTSALVSIRDKLKKVEGPDVKEKLLSSFRQWYLDHKRETGGFPEFPTDDQFRQPTFQFEKKAAAPTDKQEGGKGKGAAARPSSPKKEAAKPAGKGAVEATPGATSAKPLSPLQNLKEDLLEFEKSWKLKDDSANHHQKFDPEIVRAAKRGEVEKEIKEEVLQQMKDELTTLKSTVEGDKAAGAEGGKQKGAAAKKDAKPAAAAAAAPAAKGKEGTAAPKKAKDMTADTPLPDLIKELMDAGIIQQYEPVDLHHFIGAEETPGLSKETPLKVPLSVPQLIRSLYEYAILPTSVASPDTAELTKSKTLLLAGHKGLAKSSLVAGVATALGATLFNLTPSNTAGQYAGKPLVTRMLHLVGKIAKATGAPAIICIDEIDQVFAKKLPKEITTDPKRIRKELPKFIEGFLPEDKVMIIATSDRPWDAEAALIETFPRCLCVDLPTHNSRLALWRHLLKQKLDVSALAEVDINMLARFSDGYTSSDIIRLCESQLTDRKLASLKFKALKTEDLLEPLLRLPRVPSEDIKAFQDFCDALPSTVERNRLRALLEAETASDKKDKKGKK